MPRYEALSEAEKAELDGVRVIHSWELSQQKHGRTATPEEIADAPPMQPSAGAHASRHRAEVLFMGVHASHSRAGRWRKGARGLRRWRRTRRRSGSCTVTSGARAIC